MTSGFAQPQRDQTVCIPSVGRTRSAWCDTKTIYVSLLHRSAAKALPISVHNRREAKNWR
jgi:hypothetical protein